MKGFQSVCLSLTLILFCAARPLVMQAQDAILEPGPAQIPDWARQGRFRFTRLDGGPIEIQKTERSSWGKNFTPAEKDVLANLYGKYSDRIVDLLSNANINFVWVTYSVGYSWEDEAAQRATCREILAKLHARGIKVAAYMCAVSIFWQSVFRDVPQSVRWLAFDSAGMPFRYASGQDPLRFIADIDNPDWVKYQKRRIGAVIDDGFDAIFIDNTGGIEWNGDESMTRFIAELRRYIRVDKHSAIPLLTNFGLPENRASLNRMMEIVFDEGWQEPGVWGDDWNCSNVRRTRHVRGVNPDWKSLITEYSEFHMGTRSTSFMLANSQKLAIAEAAAFGAAQARDMEGPFDQRLVAGDHAALASWKAIGEANGFLKSHEELYAGAHNVAPLAVLLPSQYPSGFAWHDETHPIFDFLARHSILYDLGFADKVGEKDLASFRALIAPFYDSLSSDQQAMIQRYQAAGGNVYVVTDKADLGTLKAATSSAATLNSLMSDAAASKEVLGKIASLTSDGTWVTLEGARHVLANVTAAQGHNELVLHLLNYDSTAATNVRVNLTLGLEFAGLQDRRPTAASPDREAPPLERVSWKGRHLEFTLPYLNTYTVVCLHD